MGAERLQIVLYVSQRNAAGEAMTASFNWGHSESSAVNHESSVKTREPPRPVFLLINHTSLPTPEHHTHTGTLTHVMACNARTLWLTESRGSSNWEAGLTQKDAGALMMRHTCKRVTRKQVSQLAQGKSNIFRGNTSKWISFFESTSSKKGQNLLKFTQQTKQTRLAGPKR